MRYKVLVVVNIKNAVNLSVTPCSLLLSSGQVSVYIFGVETVSLTRSSPLRAEETVVSPGFLQNGGASVPNYTASHIVGELESCTLQMEVRGSSELLISTKLHGFISQKNSIVMSYKGLRNWYRS